MEQGEGKKEEEEELVPRGERREDCPRKTLFTPCSLFPIATYLSSREDRDDLLNFRLP